MAARTTWWGGGCITDHFRTLSIVLRAAGVKEGAVECPCRHAHSCGTRIIREGFYTAGSCSDGWPWMRLRLCPTCAGAAASEHTEGSGAEMGLIDEHPRPAAFDTWAYRRATWEGREAADRNLRAMGATSHSWQGPANRDRMDALTAQFDASAKMRATTNALNTQTELDLLGAQLRQSIAKRGLIQDRLA